MKPVTLILPPHDGGPAERPSRKVGGNSEGATSFGVDAAHQSPNPRKAPPRSPGSTISAVAPSSSLRVTATTMHPLYTHAHPSAPNRRWARILLAHAEPGEPIGRPSKSAGEWDTGRASMTATGTARYQSRRRPHRNSSPRPTRHPVLHGGLSSADRPTFIGPEVLVGVVLPVGRRPARADSLLPSSASPPVTAPRIWRTI